MRSLITIIKKYMPVEIQKPLGRWKIETCNTQINNKIDLSNEDHCGPCGQYALEKMKYKGPDQNSHPHPDQDPVVVVLEKTKQ